MNTLDNFPDWSCLASDSEFNLDAAVLLAQASHAAYGELVSPSAWAEQHDIETLFEFDRDNIQGFWAIKNSESILCFRGTSNIGQWIRDFKILPVSHPWGSVHRGFLDGLKQVTKEVEAFSKAMRPESKIWVTGHSLGGALAVLAGASIHSHGLRSRVYTFGQPRMGLAAFRDRFNLEFPNRMFRFINQSDIVPRIPPGLLYRHVGLAKRIVRPGILEVTGTESSSLELSSSELPQITDEEFVLLKRSLAMELGSSTPNGTTRYEGNLPLFAHHAITEYIALLAEILADRKRIGV